MSSLIPRKLGKYAYSRPIPHPQPLSHSLSNSAVRHHPRKPPRSFQKTTIYIGTTATILAVSALVNPTQALCAPIENNPPPQLDEKWTIEHKRRVERKWNQERRRRAQEDSQGDLPTLLGNLGVGGIAGFCAGFAVKKVGKTLAILIGIAFAGIQILAYKQYIKIDKRKVKTDVVKAFDQDGDGVFDAKDVKILWNRLMGMLTFGMPSSAAFAVGTVLGIRYG